MLDKNAKIEQMIHTACGKNGNGEFGIWSSSKNFDSIAKNLYFGREEFQYNGLSSILTEGKNVSNENAFQELTSSRKELKPGAVKHGIFNKKYREEDYVTIEENLRGPIVILDESSSGNLAKSVPLYSDFRENPEDAPYRIIATKLNNGKVVAIRRTYINKVYSNVDHRSGNHFDHVLVFPEGTEIKDLDVSKLPFEKGLAPKYHKSEKFPNREFVTSPEYLDPLSLKDEPVKTNSQPVKTKSEQQTRTIPEPVKEQVKTNSEPIKTNSDLGNKKFETKIELNPESIKHNIPEALFNQSVNIISWQKEIDQLNQSENFDGITEYKIEQLEAKISRADDYIRDFLKNANAKELSTIRNQCKERIEKLKTEKEQEAINKNEKFDPTSIYRLPNYQGISKLDFMAQNENNKKQDAEQL